MDDVGQSYDLVVVGGGINGVGIARDAAGQGLSVLLCEKDDLASHTSSWSSKLLHGGLRYLEYYEFRLVREALIEREVLLRAAPHLVKPMRFVLPHSPEQRPRWLIRIGLALYDNLGGRKILPPSAAVDLRRGPMGGPLKRAYPQGFVYSDAWVDDSRLVVLNALAAAEHGADIRTRTACTGAARDPDGWRVTLTDQRTGSSSVVGARAVVNAAGPWVSRFIDQGLGIATTHGVRLVKGSHVVIPALYDGDHAYIMQNDDKRIIFAIPYQDGQLTIIGTTDLAYEGDPGEARIDDDEVAYLLAVVNRYFVRQTTPDDIVWSYSGVRPLYDDASGNPSAVTRDYVFDLDSGEGRPPLLSVFGGKLTTYRKLAEHALAKLAPALGTEAKTWTAGAALPGGDVDDADFDAFLAAQRNRYRWLPLPMARRLAHAYGTRIDCVLGDARGLDDLGELLGGNLYARELDYLVREEWAVTADDVLWRRTKLGLSLDDAAQARVRAWLAKNEPAAGEAAATP
ncbi:MAG: glycerol-3-phosphate dehydrogenase [Pseudomonadota bacterium]